MKAFNNFFLHAAILAACAVVMIVDVVIAEIHSNQEFSIQVLNTVYAKIAGVIFVADLFAYFGYTMWIALFGKK